MSIKVEDLRVGNKLFHNDKIVIVDEILFDGINLTHSGYEYDYEDLKGIPLTDKDVKQYGHFNLIKVDDEYFVCFGNYKTQVKFYHDLQNYYYLVNHEEL